ncbi:hypothetical protein [Nocardia sp. MDA0666]|uniref:hypothetical protein n=1 Tax=Nocardia sp. MDA0666 TaxID=2135448 RepID=UPI0013050010|nr:hypothetical protein [Nocardia sp. MDA0666]
MAVERAQIAQQQQRGRVPPADQGAERPARRFHRSRDRQRRRVQVQAAPFSGVGQFAAMLVGPEQQIPAHVVDLVVGAVTIGGADRGAPVIRSRP